MEYSQKSIYFEHKFNPIDGLQFLKQIISLFQIIRCLIQKFHLIKIFSFIQSLYYDKMSTYLSLFNDWKNWKSISIFSKEKKKFQNHNFPKKRYWCFLYEVSIYEKIMNLIKIDMFKVFNVIKMMIKIYC